VVGRVAVGMDGGVEALPGGFWGLFGVEQISVMLQR